MESRVKDVKFLLRKGGNDVCMIGIWGMGGLGKTTIARSVYHQMSYEFEGSCFMEDVRENGSDKLGLKSLQEKLLSEILMQETFRVKDCDDGICQIRRRLGRKKVLVVLDDIDNIKQLEFLVGDHEWFGPGSRIMVTTRDEHLLCYAQEKYTPELLKVTEAMKLFSRYAFMENIPPKEYEKLSGVVVRHTDHLPLALKVLGSHFCGRNLDFWRSGLNVLAKIPHKEINGILKLSYDGLNILEKKLFLDIACFFKGRERRHVTMILDSFGFEAVSGIIVLIEKSLLTVLKGNLHMHDLIQEMGRCIVRECYPNTMLWVPKDIKEVMMTIAKLETVEAIVETGQYHFRGTPRCSAEAFNSMKKLRLLKVYKDFTSNEPKYFPEELRWLCWSLYPFQSLRITRGVTNLVGLEMPFGRMKNLQIEEKIILANLKIMDLRSSLISSFPDVSGVPNLEHLNLSRCLDLVKVHQSVLLHDRITHLDLSICRSLKILPPFIQMNSLQSLLLNSCRSLERFPEVSKEMGTLLLLNINCCDRLRELPSSIRLLTSLICLSMERSYHQQGYFKKLPPNNLRIQGSTRLTYLKILNLKNNDLLEDDFPTNQHKAWPSLEELDLSENMFARLPATISKLSRLKYIDLRDCINLKELPELPSRIQVLRADRCRALQKIGDLSNKYKWLFKISLYHCPNLLKNDESQSHVANLLTISLVQKCASVNHRLSIVVTGNKIPNWFTNQQLGKKIALNLPKSQITKTIGLAICCLLCPPWLNTNAFLEIKFKASCKEKLIDSSVRTAKSADRLWIGYMSIDFLHDLCHGFESEDLIINFKSHHDIMKCGVCAVYKDDMEPMRGVGSWIRDYDELTRINNGSANSEDLQHGRWSIPTFSFGDKKSGYQDTVYVQF